MLPTKEERAREVAAEAAGLDAGDPEAALKPAPKAWTTSEQVRSWVPRGWDILESGKHVDHVRVWWNEAGACVRPGVQWVVAQCTKYVGCSTMHQIWLGRGDCGM